MGEDLLDRGCLQDRSDDLQLAAAVRAALKVEIKDALEQTGPTRAMRPVRCVVGLARLQLRRRGEFGLFWHNLRAHLRIRCQHPMKSLSKDGFAGGWAGEDGQAPGQAPHQARAGAAGRDDAASGRQHASVSARSGVGPGGDDGRCDQRAHEHVFLRPGGHRLELPWAGSQHCALRAVCQPVLRPGKPILHDARGGRQGDYRMDCCSTTLCLLR